MISVAKMVIMAVIIIIINLMLNYYLITNLMLNYYYL